MKNRSMRTVIPALAAILMIYGVGIHAQENDGWKKLFDGTSLNGWRAYKNMPMNSWGVMNGVLYNKGNADQAVKHADLVTETEYENFQLNIDWKIAPKSNSGILYMVKEDSSAAYKSGPEYQLIDDKGYPGKLENWQKTGANYAMDPPLADAAKPVGEWNQTVIIVDHGKVEHWLNGIKVADYQLWSDTWKQHKASGKWKDTQSYGMSAKGRIALQDHGGEVWFRNINIKKL